MNKKLFFAGFALLAAVSFTSCNSDNPIDVTDPNGVRPVSSAHYLGGSYDWTAVVKDYAQLQEFWAADKDAVKKALADSKANVVNILLDVSNYELKATDVITLPNFWGAGADTNGKVVNITFQGNFKNADFERAAQIAGGTIKKFPVQINVNTLVRAEINFTFNVEKFDLVLNTTEARSTLAGEYTIGYMYADAATKVNDAIEVKAGTVEGLDLQSTGKYKGPFDGVWTKSGELMDVASNGIILASGEVAPSSKNVYVEANAGVDTWYVVSGSNKQYKLGTVKFVQKAGTPVNFGLNGTDKDGNQVGDYIENIVGFNKADCFVSTVWNSKAFDNIDAVEKVTVMGWTELKKDIFTDVEFQNTISFNTSKINEFAYVTFNWLNITVHADNQTLNFNNVNFKNNVNLLSGITNWEETGYTSNLYQWIIDSTPTGGHFELVDNNNPIKEANKDKEIVEWDKADIDYDGAGSFYRPAGSQASGGDLTNVKNSYLVLIYSYSWDNTTYIPDGTNVLLNSCKFKEATNANLNTTLTALNNIWGNKVLWDEQCWYTVYVDGAKYNWKKATDGGYSTVKYVLYPAATAE